MLIVVLCFARLTLSTKNNLLQISNSFEKPNFILINIDSLRADHMGIYGYSKNTTPFLDSLAKQGIVFKTAITPAYLTFQTDASILSGLYPSENGVQVWGNPIRDNLYLLPQILDIYDYKTAAFVSPSLWEFFGFNKKFDEYYLTQEMKNIAIVSPKIINWLKNHQLVNHFLFWHIYDVHLPYNTIQTDYKGIFSQPGSWDWAAQMPGKIKKRGLIDQTQYILSDVDKAYLIDCYDEGIAYVDSELKKFFEQMQQLPSYKNTIIIISSEHGEDLGEHGFFFHRDLYDVNIHVPLIIIAPGFSPKSINTPVSLLDIMPTILDLAKIPVPQNIEDHSLMEVMKTGNFFTTNNEPIYIERPPYNEYSVRLGDWKYILRNPEKKNIINIVNAHKEYFDKINPETGGNGFFDKIIKGDITFTDELYNLKTDPQEQNNLIGQGYLIEKKLKILAENFRTKMTAIRSSSSDNQSYISIFDYP